jgi:type IV secretion system protein TrbI
MSEVEKSTPIKEDGAPKIRRVNNLPVIGFITLASIFGVVVIYGLATRGMNGGNEGPDNDKGSKPASNFADQLTAGVGNGVIGDNKQAPQPATPKAPEPSTPPASKPGANPFQQGQASSSPQQPQESDLQWRERLQRQYQEQEMEEAHRQKMKRMQSSDAALDSPIAVDLDGVGTKQASPSNASGSERNVAASGNPSAADLYASALQAAKGGGQVDPNGQGSKEAFLNQANGSSGYLANVVIPQQSPYEIKRGTFIPATLITGINSDLPGKITAQVRENVYDSATGHLILIPQGTKLMGRYDSKVSFGQERVLVVWTDVIFPNGSTLQISNMAGMDTEGYGGFHDQVNNHYFKTFGSAVLVAIIGAGIDAASPNTTTTTGSTASAAEQAFVQSFGQFAQQTISRNLDVQPTLEIRPGYNFNVLVDQDIVLPGNYQG